MAKLLRKDALMTTAVAPLLAVSPRVQLTARPRACLAQSARRQTSPQRLVRRATRRLARETGATPGHGMRQMPLNRGTGPMGCRRWCALASQLEPRAADGCRDQALPTTIVAGVPEPPRAGAPAPLTAAQMVQRVAVACAAPAESGRPVRHGTPREVAEAVRQRGMVEPSSPRRGGRLLQSGGGTAPSGRVRAQRQAGGPRRLYRRRGGRGCRVSAGASQGRGGRPRPQDGGKAWETSAGACRPHVAHATRPLRASRVCLPPPGAAGLDRALPRGAGGRRGADHRPSQHRGSLGGASGPPQRHRSGGPVALERRSPHQA
jgi:hypothetical protein